MMKITNAEKRKQAERIVKLREEDKLTFDTIAAKVGCGASSANKIYHKYKAGDFNTPSDESIVEVVTEEFNRTISSEEVESVDIRVITDSFYENWEPSLRMTVEIPSGLADRPRKMALYEAALFRMDIEEL